MAAMDIEGIFPFITTVVSFLFFLSVSEQYFRKRKAHQLVWAISMLLFMVTAGAEGLSLLLGNWDPLIYKIYYVLAAFQVSIMGAGALYLFASRNMINKTNSGFMLILFGIVWSFFGFIFQFRASFFLLIFFPALLMVLVGVYIQIQIRRKGVENSLSITGKQFSNTFMLFTLYIFILMVYTAIQAPLDIDILTNSGGHEVAGRGWIDISPGVRATIRNFSPFFTVSGAIALIGGAFYSYFSWQRAIKRNSGSYDLGKGFFNIYIGLGALILSFAGTMSGFGLGVLYLGEAVGVILMYFGFLESDKITIQKLIHILTLGWLRKSKPVEK